MEVRFSAETEIVFQIRVQTRQPPHSLLSNGNSSTAEWLKGSGCGAGSLKGMRLFTHKEVKDQSVCTDYPLPSSKVKIQILIETK